MNRGNLIEILEKKILVLDGAMGTSIQKYNLTEKDFRGELLKDFHKDQKGNNDILSLTKPEVIKEIHKSFLKAGADIIETNSFNSTSISQEDYGTENLVYDLNYNAAKIAREVADKFTKNNPNRPRFVAGSIGPTNKTASLSPHVENPGYRDVTFDSLVNAYKEQISALIDGGVDCLLIETVFDALNCRAAIVAANKVYEEKQVVLPIMISGTLTDKSGRTLSGQLLDAFAQSVRNENVISIGLNCSFGGADMIPFIKQLAHTEDVYISCYPNAGLPNVLGEYDELPKMTAGYIRELALEKDVNIVGGCCGTTPDHIKAIAEAEAYPGPSLIIAYAPCINHGIKKGMSKAQTEEELAVKCGYWHNFRFNPAAENKFTLDSKAPASEDYQAFLDGEVRYNSLKRSNPEKAARLFAKNENEAKERYAYLNKLITLYGKED